MGYTGDGQVFALTGAYNFDTNDFWKNFLRDLELGQLDNSEGYVCATVPQTGPAGIGFVNMLGWGNAVTILPELMYWQFGDEKALPQQYESMKKFVEAEIRKMEGRNLWLGVSLGDWLALGKDMAWQAQHNNPISNSFIVHDLKVVSETAKALGYEEDAARYQAQYQATRDAYLQMFVKEDGDVADDYQSAYIMALKFVIPEGELRQKVMKKFVENVRREGLTTGFFATEHLLPMLVEAGEAKLAYDVLLQEGCPGWMYQIDQVAELVDAHVSGACVERHAGSSPVLGTLLLKKGESSHAEIAQLVEHNLAKVRVASSSLVFRSFQIKKSRKHCSVLAGFFCCMEVVVTVSVMRIRASFRRSCWPASRYSSEWSCCFCWRGRLSVSVACPIRTAGP